MDDNSYTLRVIAALDHCATLGFTEQDFADLALAAADQAMCSLEKQEQIRAIIDRDARRRS